MSIKSSKVLRMVGKSVDILGKIIETAQKKMLNFMSIIATPRPLHLRSTSRNPLSKSLDPPLMWYPVESHLRLIQFQESMTSCNFCITSFLLGRPMTAKRFRVVSIMSHFSNNYLRFSYVLDYTERLAFRRLIVIYIAKQINFWCAISATREAEGSYCTWPYMLYAIILYA